jgi:hypothetical protein
MGSLGNIKKAISGLDFLLSQASVSQENELSTFSVDFIPPYPPTFYMPTWLQQTLYIDLLPLLNNFFCEQSKYEETSLNAVWIIRNMLLIEAFGENEIGKIKAQLDIMHNRLNELDKLVSHLRNKFLSEHSELVMYIEECYKWDEKLRTISIGPGMSEIINNLSTLTVELLNVANMVGFAKGTIVNLIRNVEGMKEGAAKEIKILIKVQLESYEAIIAKI